LLVVDYRLEYTAAYAIGLIGGYWANARFVFRSPIGPRSVFGYLAAYVLTYLAALAALYLAVDVLGAAKPLGMIAALVISVPLSYTLLQRSFSARRTSEKLGSCSGER